MGIYSSVVKESTTVGSQIIECTMNTIHDVQESALNIIAEAEDNYSMLMKSVGIEELMVYESTGHLMVYTEAETGGFIAKVKEFFVNLLAKIRGLFKKFMSMFDVYAKGDKAFAAKYKKDLVTITKSLKDFKYSGYNFTLHSDTSVQSVYDKTGADKYKSLSYEAATKAREDAEDNYEKMRGAVIPGQSSLTQSEFVKELFSYFRDNETTKQDLENINVTALIQELEGSEKVKSDLTKNLSAFEKIINNVITGLERDQREIVKGAGKDEEASKKVTTISVGIQYVRKGLEIAQAYNAAHLTAIKDNSRQNKAIASALLRYNPKNESFSGVNYNEDTSFLGNVTFR